MFCYNCGKEIENSSKFCAFCGAVQEEQTAAGVSGVQSLPVQNRPGQDFAAQNTWAAPVAVKKKSSAALIIGICATVLFFAVIIIAVVLSSRSAGKKKEIDRELELAERYLDELDYDKAAAHYQAVLELDPRNEEAIKALGDTYIEWAAAEPGQAEKIYKEAKEYFEELEELGDNRAAGKALRSIEKAEGEMIAARSEAMPVPVTEESSEPLTENTEIAGQEEAPDTADSGVGLTEDKVYEETDPDPEMTEQPDEQNPPEDEVQTPKADEGWKQGYLDKVYSFGNTSDGSFGFVYLDDDDIPELLYISYGEYGLYTWSKGKVAEIISPHEEEHGVHFVSLKPGTGSYMIVYNGTENDRICRLKNGSVEELWAAYMLLFFDDPPYIYDDERFANDPLYQTMDDEEELRRLCALYWGEGPSGSPEDFAMNYADVLQFLTD